jgi:group I intron endonuclease
MIINKALLKYGHKNFSLSILEYCDLEDVIEREQFYFYYLKPEYNTLALAGSSGGFIHTEESKMKMSEARKGKKGKPHSEETKAIISEAGKGNTNRLGKIHTEEQRAKISASQPTAQRVEVLDLEGNITNYYNSIREASKAIGCSRDTVSRYIKSKKVYNGRYKIKT